MAEEKRPLPAAPSTVDELFPWIQAAREQLVGHESEPIGGSGMIPTPIMCPEGPSHDFWQTHRPSLAYTIKEQFLGHLKTLCPDKWVVWYRQFDPNIFRTVLDLDAMMAWVENQMASSPPTVKRDPSEANGGSDAVGLTSACHREGREMSKVFISYSHDSPEHCDRVRQLADALRRHGVDAELDSYHVRPPEGWPLWCEKQLRPENSKFVLMICTDTYRCRVEDKVHANEGRGVFWEGGIIYAYVYGKKGNTRFIPILLPGANADCIPISIREHTRYQIGRFDLADDGYLALYRELTEQPAIVKPALGQVVPLGSHPTAATAAPLDPMPVETTFPTPVAMREEVAGPTRTTKGKVMQGFDSSISREEVRLSSPKICYDHLKVEKLIGRELELNWLDRAWADVRTKVVIIRAWGGIGKTALVVAWLSQMAARGWRDAGSSVFDWSFYLQGTRSDSEEDKGASADAFFAEALKFFGAPEPHPISAYERGSVLARLVAETRSLLILDGLEPLQHAPGSPQAGQLTDPGMSVLLKTLARQNPGLCIVTTREKVADLNSFYGKTVDECELGHLTDEAGAALLESLGVVGRATELRAASSEVKGHALTLFLMGRYLVLAHEGEIRQRDRFKFTDADNVTQGGHAFRVLKAYETWLPTSGANGRRQLAILRLLGLFDRPADPGCLAALRQKPAIVGLTDAVVDLTDAQWNIAVKQVEEIGLLMPVAYKRLVVKGYDEKEARARLEGREQYRTLPEPKELRPSSVIHPPLSSSLEAHPLLREYFAKQLRETADVAWREGQRRLFEHLQAAVPYWPEGIDGLGPLYQAVAHGCKAGMQQKACDDVYRNRILRGTGKFGYYSTGVLAQSATTLQQLAISSNSRGLRCRGTCPNGDDSGCSVKPHGDYAALGRLSEAIDAYRTVFQLCSEQREFRSAAALAVEISELYMMRGEIHDAVKYAETSIEFANRCKVKSQQMRSVAAYANALLQTESRTQALQGFREAETILNVPGETVLPNRRLHSLPGFQYCDGLLAASETLAWKTMLNVDTGHLKSDVIKS